MKAVVYNKYGSTDFLKLEEVPIPAPGDGEVLVKVHAAAVNSWDWDLVRGKPFLVRLGGGFRMPKYKILGADIAGRVEAVGAKVKELQPGDEVFGDLSVCNWGGFAEYVCARENVLASKPASMTFEQAAAIPQAGVLALQGLKYNGQIQPGQKVLINGGGGGVGTFAIQIAKSFGAEVTAIDHTSKLELMRSIGADHVLDYTHEDFTKNDQQYDLILDVVAHRSVFDYKRALNPGGSFVMIGGATARIFQTMFLGTLISMTDNKRMGLLLHKPNKEDLNILVSLFEAGKVVPVIQKCYPLREVAKAIQHLGEGRISGKAIIKM